MHLSHIVSSWRRRRGFALVEKIILTATQTGKQTGKQTNKPTENMKSGAKTEKIKENCRDRERERESWRERDVAQHLMFVLNKLWHENLLQKTPELALPPNPKVTHISHPLKPLEPKAQRPQRSITCLKSADTLHREKINIFSGVRNLKMN